MLYEKKNRKGEGTKCTCTFRLDEDVLSWYGRLAENYGVPRSQLIRSILEKYRDDFIKDLMPNT